MVQYYGFLLNSQRMLELGIEKGLGSDESFHGRECLRTRAAWDLLAEAEVDDWCTVVNVTTRNGKAYWCIALASTDHRETVYTHRNLPPQHLVDQVKTMLEKPDHVQPMWWDSTF
ncbi:hypothetical protein CERSUDRAFT_78718 [Gelatoporia subvermispora B]|uniref:Uncharacterized protein n=1 Tax=Ceriporiopsis subvermispora (strain B) TaxID=914234 RepID=M2QXE3_CERS8|nr:hypothetical protein CERSUDRAFT_78718 [Gelatoporia subvermispora B]